MKFTTYPRAFLFSFFSTAFYRDVGQKWRGWGLLYLLTLIALCKVPEAVVLHHTVTGFIEEKLPELIDQIPDFTITDGVVTTDAAQPTYIVDPQDQTLVALVDVTGAAAADHGVAHVLLTRTDLAIRQDDGDPIRIPLSGIGRLIYDRDTVVAWRAVLHRWAGYIAYPILVLFALVYRSLQALVYGGMGLLMAFPFDIRLTYRQSVRLAAVAVTPVVLADAFVRGFGLDIDGWWLVGLAAALLYLFVAVQANSTVKNDTPVQPS